MKIAQTVFLLSLNSNNNTAKRNTTDGTNFTLSLYYTPLFHPLTLSLFLYLTNSNTKSLQIPLIQKGNVYAKISTTHMKFKKINCVNIYNVLSE